MIFSTNINGSYGLLSFKLSLMDLNLHLAQVCVAFASLCDDIHTLFAITLTLDDLVFHDHDMDSISYRGLPSSGCKTPFGSRSYELLWITLEHQELLWINSKPKDLLRTISGPQNTYQIIRLARKLRVKHILKL